MSRRRRHPSDFDHAAEIISRISDEVQRYGKQHARRRRRKRGHSRAGRVVRGALWAGFASVAFIPLMFALGYLLGPQALFWLPMILIAAYGSILYWVLHTPKPPPAPMLSAGSSPAAVALLPAQTETWLDQVRDGLPWAAQEKIDSISTRLEALGPQAKTMLADTMPAHELKRLLSEELPTLVEGYNKVPRAMQQQPLYGGASPERSLIDGLDTIDKQIGRLHEQLAKDDVHAFAAHQRYLELKYKREDEEPE